MVYLPKKPYLAAQEGNPQKSFKSKNERQKNEKKESFIRKMKKRSLLFVSVFLWMQCGQRQETPQAKAIWMTLGLDAENRVLLRRAMNDIGIQKVKIKMEIAEKIKELVIEKFPLSKIRAEIMDYLQDFYSDRYFKGSYQLVVSNTDNSEQEKSVALNGTEDLIILAYDFKYQIRSGMYFELIVGIGEYKPQKVFFSIEKCLAHLKYNDDLSLYDIDFFYSNRNQPRPVGY